jgi:Bacterial Ig domain
LRAARRTVLSLLAAISTVMVVVAPLGAASAATGPTVAIDSPATGATVAGLVTVTGHGDVDPTEGDTAKSVALLVNGIQYGAAKACTTDGIHSCPASFTWDSTGLNGQYTLQLVLVTNVHSSTLSASISVTAVNPAPAVTITSPVANAVAKGTLTVDATGSVDLSQNDAPVSLQLWVDGTKYGLPETCSEKPTTASFCHGSFSVHQPTWAGQHSVQVTMATNVSSASSATVPFLFYTSTRTGLGKVGQVHSGKSIVLSGHITAVSSGGPIAHTKVKLTLVPGVGKKRTLTVTTGASGRYSIATKIAVNTTVVASVAGTRATGASHASTAIAVLAPISCKADPTLVHGRYDAGTCTVPLLPSHTKVTLQYESKKHWHTLGSGTTAGAKIPISFTFRSRGTYPMRLVLGANKAYVATYGKPFTVKVI